MNLSDLLCHLENTTGALIHVDPIHPALYDSESLRLRPEQQVHRAPFCEFAKRHSRNRAVSCFSHKTETRALASRGKGFCDTCPFGVQEWIEPVMFQGEHAATLYLGPYDSGSLHTRIGDGDYRGTRPPPPPSSWKHLRETAGFIRSFICTGIGMWHAAGNHAGKNKPGSFYREVCARFIEGQYREDIRLADLAETLNISPNYVSARIRRECGKTFRQLLTEKRLQVACTCLEFESGMSITDIAYQVGYNDSNYFSTAFRRHMGVSPRAYREGKRT